MSLATDSPATVDPPTPKVMVELNGAGRCRLVHPAWVSVRSPPSPVSTTSRFIGRPPIIAVLVRTGQSPPTASGKVAPVNGSVPEGSNRSRRAAKSISSA